MPRTTINLGWEEKPGETLSANFEVHHGGRYEKDFEIPAGAVDHAMPLLSLESERQAVLLLPDAALTVKTSAGQTLQPSPSAPIVWCEEMGGKCHLTGDITEILVTNPTDREVVLKVRILERKPKPKVKPASPAPQEITLDSTK